MLLKSKTFFHYFNFAIFSAQFKDASYTFCAMLYGSIFDHNVTHKTSYEGFHIKAEKVYKTGTYKYFK